MFFREDPFSINQKKIQELEILLEALTNQTSELFENEGIDPNKLSAYLHDSKNFSPQEWNQIQEEKNKIEFQLQRLFQNSSNPKKAKKTRDDLKNSQHWIPIR
jgi:hypothetical protein